MSAAPPLNFTGQQLFNTQERFLSALQANEAIQASLKSAINADIQALAHTQIAEQQLLDGLKQEFRDYARLAGEIAKDRLDLAVNNEELRLHDCTVA